MVVISLSAIRHKSVANADKRTGRFIKEVEYFRIIRTVLDSVNAFRQNSAIVEEIGVAVNFFPSSLVVARPIVEIGLAALVCVPNVLGKRAGYVEGISNCNTIDGNFMLAGKRICGLRIEIVPFTRNHSPAGG